MHIKKENFREFEMKRWVFLQEAQKPQPPAVKVEKVGDEIRLTKTAPPNTEVKESNPVTKAQLEALKQQIEAARNKPKTIENPQESKAATENIPTSKSAGEIGQINVEKIYPKLNEYVKILEDMNPTPKVSDLLRVIDGKFSLIPEAGSEVEKLAIIELINKALNQYILEERAKGKIIKGEYRVIDIESQKNNGNEYTPNTNTIVFGVNDYIGGSTDILAKRFEIYNRRSDGKLVVLVRGETDDEIQRTPMEDDSKVLGRALIQIENLSRMRQAD